MCGYSHNNGQLKFPHSTANRTHRGLGCPHLASVITTNENERSTDALYMGADAAVDRAARSYLTRYNGLLLLLVKAGGSDAHPPFVSRTSK